MNSRAKELLKDKGDDVWSVGPDATVLEGLRLMSEKNIGAVMVTEGKRLLGIFSERDFARKVAHDEKPCRDLTITELMTSEIISINMDTTMAECLSLMTENRIRHLPVVQDEQLVGILTIGDVVKNMISNLELTVRDLENYISGGGYGG